MNVGGLFYNLIKDMYKISAVCVKVGQNLTDSFESSIGVIKILKRLGLNTSPCLTPIDDSNESVRFWPTFTQTAEILYISLIRL
jgi:hypothetical protein